MTTKKKERKERLSIYKSKTGNCLDSHLIKLESSKAPIPLDISGIEASILYIKKDPPKTSPSWTRLFISRPEIDVADFGENCTVGAALVIFHAGEKFVLTFGSGFHLLQTENIERDFGLRITLNSVDPDKLRSLDKASYDHNPLNSRTQSTREVDIFDLHIDSEMDILHAVTGASTVDVFGSQVTGRDALVLAVATDLKGIVEILEEALVRYNQKLPEKFEWVDNVSRVRDTDLCQVLDLELNDVLIKKDFSRLWLGEPEVVDWEGQIGYSFEMWPKSPRHPVLEIQHLCEHVTNKGLSLNCETLRNVTIHLNNNDYRDFKHWSAYRCLYAEMSVGGEEYVLRNGLWYKIDNNFVSRVDAYLATEICSYAHTLPVYEWDTEGEYNLNVANLDSSYHLMDKKNIKIGGAYDKIEFCDLVKDWKDFIHVKYYRSSSTLSHLFAQGCVAAEIFIRDQEFRVKVNSKLPIGLRLADPKVMPDARAFEVVYAIATQKNIPSQLPFFSKVTLKNSVKSLRSLGYSVKLCKIDIDPVVLMKKKYK